jgi:hypothetical protein
MRPVQPVAARTVAEIAARGGCGSAGWPALDLAGPQEAELVHLARAFVRYRGAAITVLPDAESVAGIPPRR